MFDKLKQKLSRNKSEEDSEQDPQSESELESTDRQDETEETGEETASSAEKTESESKSTTTSISLGDKAKSLLKGKRVLDEDELDDHLEDLRLTLLQNNVSMDVADQLTDSVKEELYGEKERVGKSSAEKVQTAVRTSLIEVLSHGQDEDFLSVVDDTEKPVVFLFTGINGVGKTTTIAKLSQLLEENGYSSVIANGDTYRAGASEQMREHADNLNTKLISHDQGADPTAVVYDAVEYAEANDVDVVLGDTAGRLHTSDDLMEQLAKMERVVEPDKTIFVDEAVAGQDAINRAKQFKDATAIDGLILTKSDADDSGGAILSLPYLLKTPVYYLGTGQKYSDLERFDPETIADALLTED